MEKTQKEKQREEHSIKLQHEAIKGDDNNVRVVNRWEIEILQKLPIGINNKCWTEEDIKAIEAYTETIHKKVLDYINSLLDADENLGMLQFTSGIRDFNECLIGELIDELLEKNNAKSERL